MSFPAMLTALGIGGSYLVYALLNLGCAARSCVLTTELVASVSDRLAAQGVQHGS